MSPTTHNRDYSLDILRIAATILIVFHHYQQCTGAFFEGRLNFYNGRFYFGYIVEFSQGLCERLMPDAPLWLRVVILLIAIVILCLSAALYFTADLGVSTYDAVALVWSQKQSKLRFAFCRVICDFVCVAIGVALLLFSGQSITEIFGSVGVGTIITAFFMGPLITFFNVHVAQPMLGKPKEK